MSLTSVLFGIEEYMPQGSLEINKCDYNFEINKSFHRVSRLSDSVSCVYRKERMVSQENVVPAPIIHKEKKKVGRYFLFTFQTLNDCV